MNRKFKTLSVQASPLQGAALSLVECGVRGRGGNTTDWAQGTYLYSLSSEEELLNTGKIEIIR